MHVNFTKKEIGLEYWIIKEYTYSALGKRDDATDLPVPHDKWGHKPELGNSVSRWKITLKGWTRHQ